MFWWILKKMLKFTNYFYLEICDYVMNIFHSTNQKWDKDFLPEKLVNCEKIKFNKFYFYLYFSNKRFTANIWILIRIVDLLVFRKIYWWLQKYIKIHEICWKLHEIKKNHQMIVKKFKIVSSFSIVHSSFKFTFSLSV